MEISYWQSRWNKNKTGFHMSVVYPLLQKNWETWDLAQGDHVLVPLCGKSLDMHWMMEQGVHIVGVDVSERAIHEFLKDHHLWDDTTKSKKGGLTVYRVNQSEFWVGDIHNLHPNWIPTIDAVYDKAAIVALRKDQRSSYAKHIRTLIQQYASILLQTFDYPQNEMPGPPFSVPVSEIENYFGDRYTIQLLEKRDRIDDLSKFQRRGLNSYLNEILLLLNPK